MKMSINKLIANDIINYGMDKTTNFSYIVSLDSYIDDFDENTQKYILENLDDICEAIASNDNVADFHYNKKEKEFDMFFYWDNLMDAVDHYVLNILKEKGEEDNFEIDEIKEIAEELLQDESTRNLAFEKIRNYKNQELNI